jgi:hypothetical protein
VRRPRPKLQAAAFNPGNPKRFSSNIVVLVAVLLIAAFGLDRLLVWMDRESFIYCWMVVWASQSGVGGSIALLMAVASFIVWVVFRNSKAGLYLLGGAALIKLMPVLLDQYLGFGTPCALG